MPHNNQITQETKKRERAKTQADKDQRRRERKAQRDKDIKKLMTL
jgi:hypothetical protein